MSGQSAFGVEWAILELLTRGISDPGEEERLRALFSTGDLSWGELLLQAIRHKLVASLALAVERQRRVGIDLPAKVAEHLGATLRANRHRVRVLQGEACRLGQALEAAGVAYAATKGVVLASSLYRDSGERMMADVDFLVAPADRSKVEQVLDCAGFAAGRYEPLTRRVVPFSRRETIEFQLNPYHLPHRVKLLADPLVEALDVGFANSLSWSRSGFDVPLEPLLAATRRIALPGGGSLRALRPGHEFLYLALQLCKYASFSIYLEAEADVHLAAFADLVRLWREHRQEIASDALGRLLAEPRLRGVFTWSIEHTDRLFGTGILEALGLRYTGSEEELRQVYFPGHRPRVSAGDFRRRLESKDRLRLFAAVPTACPSEETPP